MRTALRTAAILIVILLLPFLVAWFYGRYTRLPDKITIATGPVNGEWHAISHNLARSIAARCDVSVETFSESTEGALQHLRLLEQQQVDFALYLRGSRRLQSETNQASGLEPMFVGNIYTDITMFVVRRDLYESGVLRTPEQLDEPSEDMDRKLRLAVGKKLTGEHSIAQAILEYYHGPNRDAFEELQWGYEDMEKGFREGDLDAAFITAGHQAPIFKRLIEREPGLCAIGEIPNVEAVVMRNVGLAEVTVPRGLFRRNNTEIPDRKLETVGAQTMLLTHRNVSSQMVEEVTRVLLSEDFIVDNELFELSQGGSEFARGNPEFTVHSGALNVYDPRLKPLIDPEFMEATENARSFGVSLLIGAFFAYQWYRRRRERRKDHRLDEYFAELLKMDQSVLPHPQGEADAKELRNTLTKVIKLRNEALREFSAKDFEEESAADSFLSLCEAVASGIRSQLLRLQMRQGPVASLSERDAPPTASSD